MDNGEYSSARTTWLKYRWLLRWSLAVPAFIAILLGAHAELFPRWVGQAFTGEQAESIVDATEPAAEAVYASPLTGVSLIIIGILAIAFTNRVT